MNQAIKNIIAGAGITFAANVAFADTTLASKPLNNSPKNVAIAQCVDAIQNYHDSSAKLFLNNKASYREVNGTRVLSVNGWVWRDGERVRVSHQCSATQVGENIALNVVYEGDTQIADAK